MIELPVVTPVNETEARIKKPDWLRVKLPIGESYKQVRGLVDQHNGPLVARQESSGPPR